MFSCNLHPALLANDGDLLPATAVTRGWNGYQNKSQHRKSTLEKKILLPLQQGFKPQAQGMQCHGVIGSVHKPNEVGRGRTGGGGGGGGGVTELIPSVAHKP